jgi:hypothetical protein
MAMINCGECGASVSTEAKSCPACGAGRKVFRRPAGTKKPMSWPKKISVVLGVMFGISVIGGIAAGVSGTNQAPQTESAQDKQRKHMNYQAYLAAKAVKASLRNPDSLSFEQILANDDGSVICMTYRAQNGFGGMNIEHVVFKDGDPSQSHASWHAHCAGKMLNDVTAVQSMI